MAFGAGFRQPFDARRVVFDVNGAITTKGYKVGAAQVSLPRLLGDHLTVTGRARYRYFPQEDYFGIGPDSQKAQRTNYLLEETEFAGIAALRILPWLTWSSKLAHVSPDIRAGTDTRYPPIGTLFTDPTAPGLDRQPDFLETGTLLELDSRDQPGNPRSGTYITLLGARYRDLDDFGYDFSRVGGEIQHYFPVFDKKRVFAVRGAFNRYEPAAGSAVPFYYMLPVGGKDSIRGFSDFRFRDLTAVLLNAEYRWEAFAGMDMALFYDLGDAAHDWEDLSFRDLKQSYGLGLRFNTYRAIFMRTEVAFGSGEGTRFFIAFGGPLRLERYLR
jgi:outer membrane protein assembly factor BamA